MKSFERLGVWEFGGLREENTPTRSTSHTPIPTNKDRASDRASGGFWLPLLLACIVCLLATSSCAYYSFSGATIPSQLNTISIPLAVDNTISPVNTLDQDLTSMLTDRFVGQTRLSLETNEQEADALLQVRIQSYDNAPSSVGGDEQASRNRVTLRVAVTYLDQVDDEELLSQTFSSFGEYDPASDGIEGERTAAQTALENIADDIFTAATSNW